MAALSVLGVSVAPFRASSELLDNRLSAVENLVPRVRLCAASRWSSEDVKMSTICGHIRVPEFSRRILRVQVNPRSNELATIRSVSVQVARELLNAGHFYLDVRTAEEFAGGHVEGATNVPYLKSAGGGMTKNLHFVEEVARIFSKHDELVVGCLSGRRSLMAAAELEAAEFTGVTDMTGGHKAWVDSGLPTSVKA